MRCTMGLKKDESRLNAMLMGFVIGDAIGVPYEFTTRDTYDAKGMDGHGMWDQPKGTWSDDTSLTLCLVQNLLEDGTVDDLMKKFVKYRDEGYLTPYGECFDIGVTTDDAVNKYIRGYSVEDCGMTGLYSNGNGGVMRILPVVISELNSTQTDRMASTKLYTKLTHAHDISLTGSILFVELLVSLLKGNTLESSLHDLYSLELPSIDEYRLLFNLPNLKRDDVKSTGYVVDSLIAAVHSVYSTKTFSEAVLYAINLGGDTDTIGALTGALAGVIYGSDGLPSDWLGDIVRLGDLQTMFDTLITKYQ